LTCLELCSTHMRSPYNRITSSRLAGGNGGSDPARSVGADRLVTRYQVERSGSVCGSLVATMARSVLSGPYGPATISKTHQSCVLPSRKVLVIRTHLPGKLHCKDSIDTLQMLLCSLAKSILLLQIQNSQNSHPQPAGHLRRKVRNNDICPCPPDTCQHLHCDPPFINPSSLSGGLYHRKFATDVISRYR
jgi:hypothetical protein